MILKAAIKSKLFQKLRDFIRYFIALKCYDQSTPLAKAIKKKLISAIKFLLLLFFIAKLKTKFCSSKCIRSMVIGIEIRE